MVDWVVVEFMSLVNVKMFARLVNPAACHMCHNQMRPDQDLMKRFKIPAQSCLTNRCFRDEGWASTAIGYSCKICGRVGLT